MQLLRPGASGPKCKAKLSLLCTGCGLDLPLTYTGSYQSNSTDTSVCQVTLVNIQCAPMGIEVQRQERLLQLESIPGDYSLQGRGGCSDRQFKLVECLGMLILIKGGPLTQLLPSCLLLYVLVCNLIYQPGIFKESKGFSCPNGAPNSLRLL